MLQNLVLLVSGTDAVSNTNRAIPVDSDEAMSAALRAIAADPPNYCLTLDGGRQRLNCGAQAVLAMVPYIAPNPAPPPPPTPLHELGEGIVAVAHDELERLKGEASLASELCKEIQAFAKDGGALQTLRQMAAQLRASQSAQA